MLLGKQVFFTESYNIQMLWLISIYDLCIVRIIGNIWQSACSRLLQMKDGTGLIEYG